MYESPRNSTFLSVFLTFADFPKNKNGPFRGEVSVWGHFSGYLRNALFSNFSGPRPKFQGSKNRGRHRFLDRFLDLSPISRIQPKTAGNEQKVAKTAGFRRFRPKQPPDSQKVAPGPIFRDFVDFAGFQLILELSRGQPRDPQGVHPGSQNELQDDPEELQDGPWVRSSLLGQVQDGPWVRSSSWVRSRTDPGSAQPSSWLRPLAQVQDLWILWPKPTWYLLASISRRELATLHTWTLCHHGCSLPPLTSQRTPSSPDYCVIELTGRSS